MTPGSRKGLSPRWKRRCWRAPKPASTTPTTASLPSSSPGAACGRLHTAHRRLSRTDPALEERVFAPLESAPCHLPPIAGSRARSNGRSNRSASGERLAPRPSRVGQRRRGHQPRRIRRWPARTSPRRAGQEKWPLGHRNRYALQVWGWTFHDCIAAIRRTGLPIPIKSACWLCPHITKPEIVALTLTHPTLAGMGLTPVIDRHSAQPSKSGCPRRAV